MLEAYSVSHGKASPYLPLIELLKSYFDITVEDDERKRREKVNGKVLTLDRSLEDTLPYLFALLGIEDPTSSLPQMDPQIRRRRTFNALKRLFLRESLNQPLMLIFEDLHWIDSETQGFLDVLSESVASARDHLEQSIALYDPQHHHSLAFLVGGEELGVVCRDRVAVTLWWLGYPAQALQRMHEALTLAQELRSPFNLAFALGFAAMLHQFRQEGQLIQERAEALLALSHEQGFVLWLGWGSILRGWALAEQGQAEEGIAQICRGLAALQATGTKGSRPYFLALLAEAYEKVGQTEEGLNALAEALALVDKTGEQNYEADLYRLKGSLTLQKFQVAGSKFQVASPHPLASSPQAEAEAEACFLKAIEVAHRQQAKSLELRAVMND